MDAADRFAIRRPDDHAVDTLAGAPAAPQIAVDVAPESVRRAVALAREKHAVVRQPAILRDVEGADSSRARSGFDDIENLFVRREGEAVRHVDVARHDSRDAARGIEPVEIRRQLRFGHVAFVIAADAEGRIGEPDRTVGLHDDVVGRIEPPALPGVHQHGDRAVMFGAGDAPGQMFAGHEPALPVARIAVGMIGGFAPRRREAGRLVPAHDAIVGGVAPQQIAPVADPHRPLAPAAACGEPLHAGAEDLVFVEALVERLDGGIGIAGERVQASILPGFQFACRTPKFAATRPTAMPSAAPAQMSLTQW